MVILSLPRPQAHLQQLAGAASSAVAPPIRVLYPCLRAECWALVAAAAPWPPRPRQFVVCVSRSVCWSGREEELILAGQPASQPQHALRSVSPEKNVLHFVHAVVALGPAFFAARGLTPLLVGDLAPAAPADSYGGAVQAALAAAPWVAHRPFCAAAALFAVWEASILNVHPARHDALGMTVAEAAAARCPSLVAGPAVGVAHLLGAGAFVPASSPAMDDPAATAAQVRYTRSLPGARRSPAPGSWPRY